MMRNNKKDGISNMGEALNDFKSQNKLTKGLERIDVKRAWLEVMGAGIDTYTNKLIFNNGELTVRLSSSVLREELLYGKTKIIENLNNYLGDQVISKLVLR